MARAATTSQCRTAPFPGRWLAHDPAAVHLDRLAGDEAGLVAGQEEDGIGHVLRRAAELQALLGQDIPHQLFAVRMHLLGGGGEGAGGYRVDRDAVRTYLARQGAGE